MVMRRYTITTGSYDNFRVIAQVEGAATPALSTLHKQFVDQFYPPTLGDGSARGNAAIPSHERLLHTIRSAQEAEDTLTKAGYQGWRIAEKFVDWLCKEHGFTQLKLDTFHIED